MAVCLQFSCLKYSIYTLYAPYIYIYMYGFDHLTWCDLPVPPGSCNPAVLVIYRFGQNQGWVIRRIRIIRRMVFDAYFSTLNKLGRFFAFLGNFRPNNGLSMSFQCCYIIYYGKKLKTFWVILGRIGSILGQESALPNCIKYGTVLYAYFNAYFTVLNVSEVRMTHPWPEPYICTVHTRCYW
jgi:hypothetical protein